MKAKVASVAFTMVVLAASVAQNQPNAENSDPLTLKISRERQAGRFPDGTTSRF